MEGTVQNPQSVRISWSHPSTNYQHVTGYRVSYKTCLWCTSQFMDVNEAASRHLDINNLTPSTTYTFSVSANSVAGWSSSSSITITIGNYKRSNPSECTFFIPPFNYTAPPSAPPRLIATNLSPYYFTLSWTRPIATHTIIPTVSLSAATTPPMATMDKN